jgi:ubiquinone/menaquinone biosynthesis C-methylase UbiE
MKEEFYTRPAVSHKLFGSNVELLPSVDELFELELASLKHVTLETEELVNRSAFFKLINGRPTKHYLLYSSKSESITQNRSTKTKMYFDAGQFSTGYATHSLFPYRGKFHPQLIKGLLNIIGIEKGETILDPMSGSGTANIEAALMGINSYAIDVSPFCQFMTKTKYESLLINNYVLHLVKGKSEQLFKFFTVDKIFEQLEKIRDREKLKVYNLALLAYLDAMGYSKRVVKSTHEQLFKKVLNRYIETVCNFINNPYFNRGELGVVQVLPNSNALDLELEDNSIDGVVTSPPYSFAIDYVKNDEPQLEYLDYSVNELKSKMIGLRGKNKNECLNNYFQDIEKVCYEIHRVLKNGKIFIMIIGSNTNQTGGIHLEDSVIESCKKVGLGLVKSILKPIKGMRNTMRDEYILFFKKVNN